MNKRMIAITLASGLLVSSTYADNTADQGVTKLVTKLTDNQVTVVKTFPSIGNLMGVVIQPKDSPDGQQTIVYVDKNAQYLVSGALIAANGQNLSQADGKKYVTSKIAENAYNDLGTTAWIQEGQESAKHLIYIVADPNCVYCHKLYDETRNDVKKGDLKIRWIWVGFLKPSSQSIAKAIIGAKDPLAMMRNNESQFSDATEEGGIKTFDKPSAETNAKFDKNMAFINKYNFPGTPVILYKDTKGNAQAAFGLPTNRELSTIFKSATN
jgi:thiol:disulfide interchange protein DsbG